MRSAILLGLVLAAAMEMAGAERVTVQGLEQFLASSGSSHAKDGDSIGNTDLLDEITREDAMAPRIASLELTERLSRGKRVELVAKYKLGPLTQSALELLADRSALLDLPPGETPVLAPPDSESQKAMVRQASEFVFKTLTHLPDFFALLTTTQFDDGPLYAGGERLAAEPGMHLVGSSEREITFSEGREVFDSSLRGPASRKLREEGLGSQGEFGSEAAMIMLDLKTGTLRFERWEGGPTGPVAIFRYAVPQASSHYQVRYACHGQLAFHAQPGYHGTLSIDPTAGVLVRYTVQADSEAGDPITQVASAVEYGVVVLGDRRYYCPVRSLAFTLEEADPCHDAHHRVLPRPVRMLNRIVFTDYHRLGSDMVIVPGQDKSAKPEEGSPDPGPRKAPTTGPDTQVPPSPNQ